MNRLDAGGWRDRKAERKKKYEELTAGFWQRRTCPACSGSGRYDNTGSPKCGACKGSGKEWYKESIK